MLVSIKITTKTPNIRDFRHNISKFDCMWIYISSIIKTIIFPHKIKVEKSHNLNLTKYPLIIVENTENSPNSSFYTIEHKLVRNSHLLSQKMAFSQVPQQLFKQTNANCSHTKFSEQQLTAHTSIVKRITAKCYKHAPLSSKSTIVVTGVSLLTSTHKLLNK